MAFDRPYEEHAAKPPISVHPAFPAIVALWFAALLGLGSLVLPGVLLDRAVAMTGLASIVPAAAPPLGFTARGMVAIAGALVGAGIGLSIARRVANAHRPEAPSRAAKLAGGLRRPISVHEELGGEGVVNGEGLPINRRRALAISEDDRPSDFLYRAPLPGEDPDAPAAEDEPLELSDLAHDEPADEDFEMTDHQEFKSTWPSHQHYPPEPEVEEASEIELRKNSAGPRGLEPLPFSAPSLARRPVESEPDFEAEPQVRLEAVAEPVVEEPEFHADWETTPLERLGLVQLVQRLGSTIERRRELMAQAAFAPVVAAPVAAAPADFDPAPAEEAAQAMAAYFAPNPDADADEPVEPAPMPRPEFLRSLAEDHDDGDDAVPDFSLPPRRPATGPVSVALSDDEAGEADDEEGEDGYSSLLGISNPFAAPKNEFVRIDEPEPESDLAEPAVVFPGQEDPARLSGARLFDPPGKAVLSGAEGAPTSASQPPADADAALRAALATLQRMSGAA